MRYVILSMIFLPYFLYYMGGIVMLCEKKSAIGIYTCIACHHLPLTISIL